MADLLTHVLLVYVVLTPATWFVDRVEERYVVLAMGGAGIPDLIKVGRVVDAEVVEATLGLPFAFAAFGTVGGVIVVAGIVAVCFREARATVYAFVGFGGFSALLVDGMRVFADGRADFWLFPLWWRPPTPNLYVSSDPRVLAVVLSASAVTFLVDRYVVRPRDATEVR